MCPAQRFQVDTEESLLVVTLLFPSYLGETNLDSPEDGGECNENDLFTGFGDLHY